MEKSHISFIAWIKANVVKSIVIGVLAIGAVSAAIALPIALKHEHTYSEEWSKDATYHWHAATCKHTDEIADKAIHTWDDGKVTKAATETEKGEMTYTCTVCKQTRVEDIDMLSHTHTFSEDWESDATYHWHAATCAHTTEISAKAEHDWDDGKVTKEATEEAKGEKTFTCKVCKRTRVEEIPVLQHTHNPDNSGSCKCGSNFGIKPTSAQITANDSFEAQVVNHKAYINLYGDSDDVVKTDFWIDFFDSENFSSEPAVDAKSIVKEIKLFDPEITEDAGKILTRQIGCENSTSYYFYWEIDTQLDLDKDYNLVITFNDEFTDSKIEIDYLCAFDLKGIQASWAEDAVWEVEYDGEEHGVSVEIDDPNGTVEITYKLKNADSSTCTKDKPVEAGVYDVYAFAENGHSCVELKHDLVIKQRELVITTNKTFAWKGTDNKYKFKLNSSIAPKLLDGAELSCQIYREDFPVFAFDYSNILDWSGFEVELTGDGASNYKIDLVHSVINVKIGLILGQIEDKTSDLLAGFSYSYKENECCYYKITPATSGIYELSYSDSYLDAEIDTYGQYPDYPDFLPQYGNDNPQYFLEADTDYIVCINCHDVSTEDLTVKLIKNLVTPLSKSVYDGGSETMSLGADITMFQSFSVSSADAGVYQLTYDEDYDNVQILGAEDLGNDFYKLEAGKTFFMLFETSDEVIDAEIKLTKLIDASSAIFTQDGLNTSVYGGNKYYYAFNVTTWGNYELTWLGDECDVSILGVQKRSEDGYYELEVGTYILVVDAGQEDTLQPHITLDRKYTY